MKNVAVIILWLAALFCQAQDAKILSPEAFKKRLSESKEYVLVDVRTPEEVKNGHLKGAINVDYNASSFEKEIAKLDTSKTYFLYCGSGIRSHKAAGIMKEMGFRNIFEMEGGVKAWKAKGFPLEKK